MDRQAVTNYVQSWYDPRYSMTFITKIEEFALPLDEFDFDAAGNPIDDITLDAPPQHQPTISLVKP
eukprot:1422703-Karenia_brevis.AAC.1